MIPIGNYSLKDLKKILNISDYQWKKRKEDLIQHLMLYFDLDIVISDNSNYTFIIYQQYDEYEPLPRKGHNEKRRAYYKDITHEILEKEPYNSGSNIARVTVRDKKQYEQDSWRTVANHAREIMKEDYDKTEEHIWGFIDESMPAGYSLLTNEQVKYLNNLFADGAVDKTKSEAHIYSQKQQGIISEQQAEKQLSKNNSNYYSSIFKNFKQKFGRMPISIPKWILKGSQEKAAWDI